MLLVKFISLLVSLKSLRKSVLDNRLNDLDNRELAIGVEVEILVLVNLLGVLGSVKGDGLDRGRFLTTHGKLEGVHVGSDPNITGRSAISVNIGLRKLHPGGHLGSLLLVLGSGKSTLDRLGGRVYVRLGIRYLEGSEQCQNNQCLFHDYWYLVVSKYTILEESPRSPQQPFPVRHHLSRQSRWRRSSHRS